MKTHEIQAGMEFLILSSANQFVGHYAYVVSVANGRIQGITDGNYSVNVSPDHVIFFLKIDGKGTWVPTR